MEEFVPGQVYDNLVKMMAYRGVTISSEIADHDAVAQKLNHYEFIIISGLRGPGDSRGAAAVHILLIAPGSKYAAKSGDFKKLLAKLPKPQPDYNLEVIFVSMTELTPHIVRKIKTYQAENPGVSIEAHLYKLFMIESPKHAQVPKHVIMTPEELNEFCTTELVSKKNFQKIIHDECQAVWLGLKPGMVVKIYRISETAGESLGYRLCI